LRALRLLLLTNLRLLCALGLLLLTRLRLLCALRLLLVTNLRLLCLLCRLRSLGLRAYSSLRLFLRNSRRARLLLLTRLRLPLRGLAYRLLTGLCVGPLPHGALRRGCGATDARAVRLLHDPIVRPIVVVLAFEHVLL